MLWAPLGFIKIHSPQVRNEDEWQTALIGSEAQTQRSHRFVAICSEQRIIKYSNIKSLID